MSKIAIAGLLTLLAAPAVLQSGAHPLDEVSGPAPAPAAPAPLAEGAPELGAAQVGGNLPPVCVAESPGQVLCTGGVVLVPLDATQSYDPDDDPLTFEWVNGCPDSFVEDPTAPLTHLVVDTSAVCDTTCAIRLRVSDGRASSFCRTVLEFHPLQLPLDIKPGSCPNPINVGHGSAGPGGAEGVLPVSLLGTKSVGADAIDPESLALGMGESGFAGEGPVVYPINIHIDDTATPFEGELCDCHELTGDGTLDVMLHFDRAEVVSTLGLDEEEDGSFVVLRLFGQLGDGTLTFGDDCVRIINHGN